MSALPTGTVYGALLNQRSEFDALAPQMHDAPYKAPPRAPVLYIKTANTFSPAGAAIAVPVHVPEVEIGATVGLLIGDGGAIQGCMLMNDLSVPHASFYRPPVRFRCLDGFLGVGADVHVTDPATVQIEVRINGALCQTVGFDVLVRPPTQLLADVAEFMTLAAGDVLMLGCAAPRPRARAGDHVELRSAALGTLAHTLIEQAP